MSKLLESGHGRPALQLCAAVALAALMSGCSADATRTGDPFGNPFGGDDAAPVTTPRRMSSNDTIPAGRTPPVTSQALSPRAASVASAPLARPARSVAFREPISRETTGSIDPGAVRTAGNASFGGWTTSGGTPIQVADGETATILAQRYGVPTASLVQVNGLKSAGDVRPGAHIVIPVYSASAPRMAQTEPRIEERRPEPMAVVAPRERSPARPVPFRTVAELAPKPLAPQPLRAAPKPIVAEGTASAADLHQRGKAAASLKPTPVKTAMAPAKVVVATTPAAKVSAVKAAPVAQVAAAPIVAAPKPAKVATVPAPKPEKVAIVEVPKVIAAVPAPTPVAAIAPAVAVAAPGAPVAAADGSPEFRWPARGRIIQAFKGGSTGNDGINIAVPEGTSVKAAESGVVAYAGSELKGYGNLVLIRHPNGFVSAYANNGELDVKRGETVKRGQQIAKSGQSGNVSSPQLHFELRKGSTPVDPTQYLAGL